MVERLFVAFLRAAVLRSISWRGPKRLPMQPVVMPSETALKLQLEPGEYQCTWSLPKADGSFKDFPGVLSLESGKPPEGSAHGDLPISWSEENGSCKAGFPQVVERVTLRGHLINGYDVLLVDASVHYWFPERAHLSARAAVVGLWLFSSKQNVDSFSGIKMQVTGLDVVAGVAPLKSFTFPAPNAVHLSGLWSAEGNPESSQEWTDASTTLRLEYDGSARIGDPYSYGLAFSPVVLVRSDHQRSLEQWLDEWIDPIARLITLATGRREETTYLALEMPSLPPFFHPGYAQVFGSGLTQVPYESRQRDLMEVRPALRLKADGLSMLTLVNSWQPLREEHHPLVETYGAVLGAERQHPRARFLLLIQALEGLHGYETKPRYERRVARHVEQRRAVLDAVLHTLDEEQQKFLKKNLSKRPASSLDDALRAQFTSLPLDLTHELATKRLIQDLRADPRPHDGPVGTLRLIRNDLAHGRQGYDALDLHEVDDVLERVTRAHLLRILGCPTAVVERALST